MHRIRKIESQELKIATIYSQELGIIKIHPQQEHRIPEKCWKLYSKITERQKNSYRDFFSKKSNSIDSAPKLSLSLTGAETENFYTLAGRYSHAFRHNGGAPLRVST